MNPDNTHEGSISLNSESATRYVDQLGSKKDIWEQIRKARARCTLCVRRFGDATISDNLRLLSRPHGDALVCRKHREWTDAGKQPKVAESKRQHLVFMVYSPKTGQQVRGDHTNYTFGGGKV